MTIDASKTSPEKLAEMNDSLITDNNYLRGRVRELESEAVQLHADKENLEKLQAVAATFNTRFAEDQAQLGAKQAEIDRLMIEYCPDKVTDEQWAEWCSHQHPAPHLLWETGEVGVPSAILDWNGEVVLGLCKVCGRAECELDEPCTPKVCGREENKVK